jgi:hypothetical protein
MSGATSNIPASSTPPAFEPPCVSVFGAGVILIKRRLVLFAEKAKNP